MIVAENVKEAVQREDPKLDREADGRASRA